MNPSRLALSLFAAGALAAALPACILACNDIGCAGGLDWRAHASDALPPGDYTAHIDLEGTQYEVACEVAATIEQSRCGQAQRIDGDGEFTISLSPSAGDLESWDPSAPVTGFALLAVDVSESDDQGLYSANRGPTEVSVAMTTGSTELFAFDYDIEYERDDNYRGDPRCGYCDQSESRSEVIEPLA